VGLPYSRRHRTSLGREGDRSGGVVCVRGSPPGAP